MTRGNYGEADEILTEEPLALWDGCEKYSEVMNAMSGWLFGDMLNHYVRGVPIVLQGEGEKNNNLVFAATRTWLIKNNIANRFGTNQKEALDYIKHVSECESPMCQEAYSRYQKVEEMMGTGQIPGGERGAEKISLASLFEGGNGKLVLSRENGWEEEISALKPYFEWFTGQNKRKWIW